ncbi:MAG: hypothetical protein ABH842_05765 [Candidatus Micrarchaeota archaeon]
MADAAIARRQVERRPVAVPSGAAATKPRSEGLAMTISAEDRTRFITSAQRYDKATPSTEERFSAMKEFIPILRETYRKLSGRVSEKDASDEDRRRHHDVAEKLRGMLEELREGSISNRYEIRHLAFRILAENGINGEITAIAKGNKHEDLREAAVRYFMDDIGRSVSTNGTELGVATKTYVLGDDHSVSKIIPIRSRTATERRQTQQLVARKKDGLLEIGETAIYSDTRERVAEYFAEAGDTARLNTLKAETRYQDTKILIGDLVARMQRNSASTADLVESCIADYFGGDKEPAVNDDIVSPPVYSFAQRRKKQPPEDGHIYASTGTDNRPMAQA